MWIVSLWIVGTLQNVWCSSDKHRQRYTIIHIYRLIRLKKCWTIYSWNMLNSIKAPSGDQGWQLFAGCWDLLGTKLLLFEGHRGHLLCRIPLLELLDLSFQSCRMLRHAGTCWDCKAEGVEARKIGRARTWTYNLLSSRFAINFG